MTTINFGTSVTLSQAAKLITHVRGNRIFLQGEPGIGKSSLLAEIARLLPDHIVADPIDVPNMDLGDIAMPVVDRERMVTNYAPNSRFKLTQGKPVIIMLDEFTKGADPIKNMLHPLLEVSKPRLGDVYLHPDTVVFLTGNLASDGVGDSLKGHSRNRLSVVSVRKPDSDEWLGWAVNNDIDGAVCAWVKQYPHALASYTDGGQSENPYIYNPRKASFACVSPRSLFLASNIVKNRQFLDTETTIAALAGTVGEAAARDMQAFLAYQDQLPAWDAIIKNPQGAIVPTSAGACAVLVFGAIAKISKETISPFMEYLNRFDPEWQATFAINVAKSPSKQSIAFSSIAFRDWITTNEDIL